MFRRAAIYIRTSSETQGAHLSPIEQEADCRRLAAEKGLQVVRIYRDVEKYRVGNKLVEPSGSRSDRPGLQLMLKDATRDEFDVIHPGVATLSSRKELFGQGSDYNLVDRVYSVQ